jgi:hypothetical protein
MKLMGSFLSASSQGISWHSYARTCDLDQVSTCALSREIAASQQPSHAKGRLLQGPDIFRQTFGQGTNTQLDGASV